MSNENNNLSSDEAFESLSATFREGKEEPFHTWYPYLEGYSPEFVNTVLENYMQDANSILDPFGGTVTTGFTASREGIDSYYCEVNPVLQFVANTKSVVRTLSIEDRRNLANRIQKISNSFEEKLSEEIKNKEIMNSYNNVFEDSEFFDEETLEQVLSSKTLTLNLNEENEVVSNILSVAIISSLIPCSNLKRGGDVQYMDEEKQNQTPSLVEEVPRRLDEMAEDLVHKDAKIEKRPSLLCESAKNLDSISHENIDGVITSPPYINGTNYFRNTKLELWFLGFIEKTEDLTEYRNKSLTAGINTVSGEYDVPDIELVKNVVNDLEEHGYDSRLHRMVAGYCSELQNIFRKMQPHLNKGSRIAIDIGDSIYAGVHVPSDEMIIEILTQYNYNHIESVKLRDRYSNNGKELKQVLLVFEYR